MSSVKRVLGIIILSLAVLILRQAPVLAVDGLNRTVLPNGLTLLVREQQGEDIVALEILFRSGLLEEEEGIAGSTNLILNILLQRISGEGADDVESTGSVVRVSPNPDYGSVSITTTGEYFLPLLRRVAGALNDRTLKIAEVDKEKTKVLQQIEAEEGSFKAIYSFFLRTFYKYHPYRNPETGFARTVESVSAENLQDYFSKYFVPNRTVISIVGNVHKKDVIDKVGDLFGNLKPWTAQRVPIPWEPKPEENYLPLSSGSSLAWLLIGFPAPSYGTDDYAGMRVLYSLLGEGLSCRFWMEVREKRGLSYEIGGMYPVLNGPCHVASYFITSPGQVNQVRKAMMGEIRRIRSERVSPDELEGTKRKVLGKFLLERDTRNGLAAALGAAEVLGVGYQYDQTFPSLVQKVTDSDILYLAREYLENYTLIIARPAGEFYFE